MTSLALAPAARAADTLGGHFGVVFAPLVSSEDDSTIFDNFALGFPMGITVKRPDRWAFDLELVPSLDPDPIGVGLTVHPGVLRDLGGHWTLGLRLAFDVGGNAWGFTPLLNRGFPMADHALFVEAVAPVRFKETTPGDKTTVVGLGVHVGLGF